MASNRTINLKGSLLDFDYPKVMGVLNVTPDSFFAGSRNQLLTDLLTSAENMLSEGATFLDIGGYSSRPGASDVSLEEEISRIRPAISEVIRTFPNAKISIDTFRAEVAEVAISEGAAIVNDISGGHLDDRMIETVAKLGVPYIAMHMKGTPQTMKGLAHYDDVMLDVVKYFSAIRDKCYSAGVKDLLIDPGFGFAKTPSQSFELLSKLEVLQSLECSILVGVSRKSMIYRTLGVSAEEALNGTSVLNTIALLKGASILRVHDVKEAAEAIKLVDQLA